MIVRLSAWYVASCMMRRAISASGSPLRVKCPWPSSNRPFTAAIAIRSVVTSAFELSSASFSRENSSAVKPCRSMSVRSGTVRPSGRGFVPLRTSSRCQYACSYAGSPVTT